MNKVMLLWDLDDSLIPNAYTYSQPQLDMTGLILWDLGYNCPDPVTIINHATLLQIKDIKEKGKISKHNFPMSYVDVYNELCKSLDRIPNYKIQSAIFVSGLKYFKEKYELYPNVIPVLQKLSKNFELMIVTRGDFEVQNYKIDNTKIRPYFKECIILDVKNTQSFLDIIAKYELNPNDTYMIGDSLRNDILPALEAGMKTIQIKSKDASDWEKSLGNVEVPDKYKDRYNIVNDITGVLELIEKTFIFSSK